MHQLKVLALGSNSFVNTLIELKPFLKFNLHSDVAVLNKMNIEIDVLILDEEFDFNSKINTYLNNTNLIKILMSKKNTKNSKFDGILKIPTTINEINSIVENLTAKQIFNKNSSIKIKEYLLDKNEKKLAKGESFIILTEKEIQLLELFLSQKKPISKKKILALVWNYSSEADTHTVETHIYRLRKKINEQFLDDKFINNNKEGYFF